MSALKETLMANEGLTSEEADEQIEEIRSRITEGEDPAEILEELCLDPEFLEELL